MSHALNNAGHNCNIVTQAEAMVMTKERVIERYGELRYTIGSGCSGGSLVQQQVANAYPGLYQGISPQCSFTDAWSSAMQYVDYVGLLRYFEDPTRWEPGTVWDPVAITEVLDHPNPANPVTFTIGDRELAATRAARARACPTRTCTTRRSNPGGVKCTLQDYMVNVFGQRPDGFANRAHRQHRHPVRARGAAERADLARSSSSTSTPRSAASATTASPTPERVRARPRRPASAPTDRARSTRRTTSTRSRSSTCAGPTPAPSTTSTAPTRCASGCCATSAPPPTRCCGAVRSRSSATPPSPTHAILALDKWLARVEADRRSVGLARKILENRPATVTDRCTDGLGHDVPAEVCDQTVAPTAPRAWPPAGRSPTTRSSAS